MAEITTMSIFMFSLQEITLILLELNRTGTISMAQPFMGLATTLTTSKSTHLAGIPTSYR